ncbi:hypothetical protein E2320_003619 [Naja naja]|nr:hypothetical protein E2320_003619 [Naja naja]
MGVLHDWIAAHRTRLQNFDDRNSPAILFFPSFRSWLAKTDPKDVARVESRTVIVTEDQRDTIPITAPGVKGQLGNWMNPKTFQEAVDDRFPGCMKEYGDSITVGAPCMSSPTAWARLVRRYPKLESRQICYVVDRFCYDMLIPPHSRGWRVCQMPAFGGAALAPYCTCSNPQSAEDLVNNWPCNPEKTLIAHVPNRREIVSFGSGYGGNSLLGKKCFALRIASCIAKDEGWLAEHMLILGLTNPEGKKKYVAAAFPSCLRAINPENGFFGVAPGTSTRTNPNAMHTIQRDPQPAAHPNSRFCAPARQCPIMDPDWESPQGVPIDAIIFGGRRPAGVPLVYEAFNWRHGVFVGSAMRSESTAAAEHKGKVIMHDPFAMRPFFGYNFGRYLEHWLGMEGRKGARLPKIFHVNWFRKDAAGNFLWPGFGENSRVLDWIFRRVDGEESAKETPIGYVPKEGALDLSGLSQVSYSELFSLPKEFWEQEVREVRQYLTEQVPEDLPKEVLKQLEALETRVKKM